MKKSKQMKNKLSRKLAQPPGTLIHIGDQRLERIGLNLIRFNEESIEEIELDNLNPQEFRKDNQKIEWLNITGLHDVDAIEKIGQLFNIHSLVLEDILNTTHRPKYEDLENYFFVVLKMISYDEKTKSIKSEQVSLILMDNTLLTFQEWEGDIFDPIRDRLRKSRGKIRKLGADYLFYCLIDAVVDNYSLVIESIGEEIEEIEDTLLLQPLHHLKREMIFFRKGLWPLREVINGIVKSESILIKRETEVFFRDIYDHIIQALDTIDTYREMLSGLQDLYLSSVSNKMNEVMKVLTIIATIFIPLTFIAGVYGMNFEFMPELHWKIGYFLIWGIMILSGFVMYLFFKRKKWL